MRLTFRPPAMHYLLSVNQPQQPTREDNLNLGILKNHLKCLFFAASLISESTAFGSLTPAKIDSVFNFINGVQKKNSVFLSMEYFRRAEPTTNDILSLSFEYKHAISEKLSYIFPLGLMYALPSGGFFDYKAVSWNIGVFSRFGYGIFPYFDSYARKTISANLDFEVQIEYGVDFPFNRTSATGSLGLSFGTRHHLSKEISVTPAFQIITQDIVLKKVFVYEQTTPTSEKNFEITTPFLIGLNKKTGADQSLGFEYTFRGLGLESKYSLHAFQFYWNSVW